ncbi:(2Fe-2S)-binding protein [Dietzia cinnamea]|uniref:(2Fe-2S)-binding protein n=1 Tax=Dietzia cinnamea TaxID=321318 RepID=UPI00223ABC5E|nr:(2Fe-2S)-binding protein [Dietzia cinnamea]MCT2299836.1 (2Fe-2S)-binding protein [Dietzia cinnamea]
MPEPVAAAYANITTPLGEFARTIEYGPEVLPGTVLTDLQWLDRRIADTGRRWSHDDPRVNATLWWYSASSTLAAAPLAMLLSGGVAPDPRPERLTVSLQTNGYLRAARSDRLLRSVTEFAEGLREAHEAVIASLAEVSGAAPRALWAIASDSIGNRALEAGRAGGDPERGCDLARAVSRPPLLPVRYIDIEGPEHTRRFVHRGSCCLIYVATAGDKCVSCPRRTPEDRHAELLGRTSP